MSFNQLTIQELDEFLQSVADELYTYGRSLTRDKDLTDDLIQTVFTKFIERVRKGDVERDRAAAYLMRMTRNAFIDMKRRSDRLDRLVLEDTLSADERKSVIESQSRYIQGIFLEAIAAPHLDVDVVEVLRLRFISEISVNEICMRMGKSRSTIHRLMRKGLDHLTEVFQAAGLSIEDLEY